MDADLRRALAGIAGAKGVSEGGVVRPATPEQVAAILRACAEHGARVAVVSGAASRADLPTEDADVLLTVSRLDGVSVDESASVAWAGGGAELGALRSAADGADRALIVPPARPGSPSHVGSLIASGALPRWALTGIEAVLGSGEIVRAGGTVQRDVTGYDLIGALVGSAGRLAVVTEAWFRLQPKQAPAAPLESQGVIEQGILGDALRAAFDPRGVLTPAS